MSNKNLAAGPAGGTHVTAMPLTTEIAQIASPDLLVNSIDEAIVKIRPMATPLDQISRLGHVRPVKSMEVDYYSVDTRKDSTTTVSVNDAGISTEGGNVVDLDVAEPSVFEPSETFFYRDEAGETHTGYVLSKKDATLRCVINDKNAEDNFAAGTPLIRMGRAATQLDVQSPQFSVLPTRHSNNCQIFKMQIEQSIMMRESHKSIGWDFNDQQEAAVYDMRCGMEKQFLFGNKMKFYDTEKGETVMLTQGVWHQAGRDIRIDLKNFDSKALVDMLREAFTKNSGSRRKVLMGGSELIAALNKLDAQRVITARDQVTAWGIDFSELSSKFGKLYVVYNEIFDTMGRPGDGMIIDPEYIQKHIFIPFTAEQIDLRGSGQRNTEAMVLTEASCLTLRYPDAHARITGV